jgi:hypothetical protein
MKPLAGCRNFNVSATLPEEGVMDNPTRLHEPIEKPATEARQGRTTGRVRWILAISMLAAIVAMAVAYWIAIR